MRQFSALAGVLGLCACTQFPELDATATPGVSEAPYPELLPLSGLLDAPPPRATPEVAEGVDARTEALRRRADALRGEVIDPDARSRLDAGVDAS
ncbi:hypothetical protein [Allosediminivita pacifica]|uniref:Uncharacterized protein n=1 Tax=Allosediminivita pacifica TaxID=1267769 RepID=A0A2T6ABE2_9RHOB|nr:hypothetical protein [Allosediminivita pacifica]PTX41129.1 hypothetical protein C8N44_13234 [Allosediminivita pacifica]GGB24917.1 hypothetical protein GCM10011324_38600 [Allosediminivita pacifica]